MIPYRQGAEKVGIEILNGDSKEHVLEDIKAISKVIKDDSDLEKKCVEFFDNTDYYLQCESHFERIMRTLNILFK